MMLERTVFRMFDRYPVASRVIPIVVVGLLAYGWTFFFDSFNFDDSANILGANARRNQGPITQLLDPRGQRSLGFITFALNYRIFGPHPQAFHVTNVVIHILTSLSLVWLVSLILSTPRFEALRDRPLFRVVPLVAGLLFVSHPIQSQAVAYIVQRFTSLATLFYLLSLVFYLKGRTIRSRGETKGGPLFLVLMVTSIICAIQSKEIAATIPLSVILVELLFFNRDPLWRLSLFSLIILPVALIPLTLFGAEIFRDPAALLARLRVQTNLPRDVYFFSELPVLLSYLKLTLLPVGQSVEHTPPIYRSFLAPPVLFSALFHLLVIGVAVFLAVGGRRGDPAKILAGFGLLWFYVTSLVESSVIPFIDLMFEHRVYLPFAGLSMGVAGVTLLFRTERVTPWCVRGVATVTLLLTVVTIHRTGVWRTPVTLWRDAVEKSPNSSRAWNNLAYAYLKNRQPNEAIPALLTSIDLDPGKTDVWNNLAIALDQLGIYRGRYHRVYTRFSSAEDYYTSQTLWFANAWNNLGLVRQHVGQYAAAIQAFRKALEVYPDLAVARFNLGSAAILTGNPDLAINEYERLLTLAPEMAATLRGIIENAKRQR
ncbi:MAG: tetratricopeptide repeat protein [Desulfuromonadia bacterium]